MDEFLSELSNPSWWISVVVAGIFVNIFSDYIKIFLEKIFSRYSQRVREKWEKNKDASAKEIESLSDSNKLLNAKTDLIYLTILMILYTSFYILVMLVLSNLLGISSPILYLIWNLWYFVSLISKLRRAFKIESLINKYYKKQDAKNNNYSWL